MKSSQRKNLRNFWRKRAGPEQAAGHKTKGGGRVEDLEKLRQMLAERGWSEYRLSQECGLSESTIANIYRRNTLPTISTLESIGEGFGISLAQFFAQGDLVELTPEWEALFTAGQPLTPEQKAVVLTVARSYQQK